MLVLDKKLMSPKDALVRLQYEKATVTYWIDAICISQSDTLQKCRQILESNCCFDSYLSPFSSSTLLSSTPART